MADKMLADKMLTGVDRQMEWAAHRSAQRFHFSDLKGRG
ncbi:hypothetical protein C8R31_101323 [Nitrosospira sp. Nsp2]|nr:hypothetical protein C8R31_101323 [Nitrosospira sp. Nsp2]